MTVRAASKTKGLFDRAGALKLVARGGLTPGTEPSHRTPGVASKRSLKPARLSERMVATMGSPRRASSATTSWIALRWLNAWTTSERGVASNSTMVGARF